MMKRGYGRIFLMAAVICVSAGLCQPLDARGQEAQIQESQSQEVQGQEVLIQESQFQEVQGQDTLAQENQSQEIQGQDSLTQEGQSQEIQIQTLLSYEDLEVLIRSFSPKVQMERSQYESRLAQYEEAREEMMETRRRLREEAKELERSGDKEGAEHYYAQGDLLKDAADEMESQIHSVKNTSNTMYLKKLEDTTVRASQKLMSTYNSLKLSQEAARSQAEWKYSILEKVQKEQAAGMASAQDTEAARREYEAASGAADALLGEMERTRQQLFLLAGQKSQGEIEIGMIPEPDPSRMESMDPWNDQRTALGNNYELREQRGGSFSGTNKELHVRQRSINESEQIMYGKLDTLYQQVQSCHGDWIRASAARAASQERWKGASHQYQLGMLSRQEYLKAQYEYLEGCADYGQSAIGFFQAMEEYDWAKKGLME